MWCNVSEAVLWNANAPFKSVESVESTRRTSYRVRLQRQLNIVLSFSKLGQPWRGGPMKDNFLGILGEGTRWAIGDQTCFTRARKHMLGCASGQRGCVNSTASICGRMLAHTQKPKSKRPKLYMQRHVRHSITAGVFQLPGRSVRSH